jgi:hypothetical protein
MTLSQTTRTLARDGRADYVRHEGFLRPLCETLGPSHVQGRRNAREAANTPRRENNRLSSSRPRGQCLVEEVKARRLLTSPLRPFCRLHPADVTDRGAIAAASAKAWADDLVASEEKCQRRRAPKAVRLTKCHLLNTGRYSAARR